MNTAENLRTTAEYLPQRVRQAVMQLAAGRVLPQEIRLRSGRPVSVTIGGRDRFLTPSGMLTDAPEKGIAVTPSELGASFHAVCAYSVHSHVQDVAEGFVTIRGGCRVGICGTAVTQPDGQAAQRQITSLNFRIAGEAAGTAQGVWTRIGSRPAGIRLPVRRAAAKRHSCVICAGLWEIPAGQPLSMNEGSWPACIRACRSMMWVPSRMCSMDGGERRAF